MRVNSAAKVRWAGGLGGEGGALDINEPKKDGCAQRY